MRGDKRKLSGAQAFVHYRSASYCRGYLAPLECEVEDLYPCDRGHVHCAHYRTGACREELARLIEAYGAMKEAA